jgi:N-acetylmuramic acid 6-phosphate etherase
VKRSARNLRRTEQRSTRSARLDQQTTQELLLEISRQDLTVAPAVARTIPQIAQAADAIAAALRDGGRLLYVGAGTSGRIAALDAAECPPTFGTSPALVQAVVAGGKRALVRSAEDAEDSSTQGKRDMMKRRVSPRDVVVGVTASGSTPYVLGAMRYAKQVGATTVFVGCNRHSPLEGISRIAIVVDTGPEIIAGSTRMKAGTAQKMILNMLSTAAMVQLGRVYNNWMIDVAPSNRKLRARAVQILREATGAKAPEAERAWRLAKTDLRHALLMLKTGVGLAEARRKLKASHGNLRQALNE